MVAAAAGRDPNPFSVHGPGVLVKAVHGMDANEVQSESWFQANPKIVAPRSQPIDIQAKQRETSKGLRSRIMW